jgi:alanine-synthesizing transaminase
MPTESTLRPSDSLRNVRYEIRGKLANRAHLLTRQGYEIISLNIGNPAAFGFRAPESMRLAMIENLKDADGYVVMQQQARGVTGVTADEVFIGNGVSELIDLALRALLNDGDEVLVPSPDYPLWTAAATLNGGRVVHYPCLPENKFIPDPEDIAQLITKKTRAIIVINPNNPTGAVYPREVLEGIARLAERHGLVVFADEIYDQMTYDGHEFIPMATLVKDTLCATMSGISKVYRACGYRVGWASFSGRKNNAGEYLAALELLSSLRLCSNVPGQWAVQTALGGYQSIKELVSPGGRLYESRRAIVNGVASSRFLEVQPMQGAMYAFIGVKTDELPDFDDQQFGLDLLEQKHVLIAPGSSFNVPYRNRFRITNLPDATTLRDVFNRIEDLLLSYANGPRTEKPGAAGTVVEARQRFK